MSEKENIEKDAVTEHNVTAKPGTGWQRVADRISYKGIVHNMPYLMFVTFLCIIYITNNNRAIALTRSLNEQTKVLKELKWCYLDLQSRLMYQTSESQLILKTEAIGLRPLEKPAFEIRIKKMP